MRRMDGRTTHITVAAAVTAIFIAGCATGKKQEAKAGTPTAPTIVHVAPKYDRDISTYLPHPEDVRYSNVEMLNVAPRDANGVHYRRGARPYLIAQQPVRKIERVTLPWRVTFDFDAAVVKSDQYGVVQSLVRLLNANPDLRVALVGYADAEGPAKYNRKLAKRRAVAVKKAMLKLGLHDAKQIVRVESASETDHLSNHANRTQAASNRRVDAFVVAGG